jgi:acyl carrier protein
MKRFELKVIVANVLEIDPELLSAEVDLDTFENFDSVHVLMLVLELEQQAGVIMTSEEASCGSTATSSASPSAGA